MSKQTNLVVLPPMQALMPTIDLLNQRNRAIFDSLELINSGQIMAINRSIQAMLTPYVQMQASIKQLTDIMNSQVAEALKSATAVRINIEFFATPLKSTKRTISLPSTYVVAPADLSVISVRFDELGFVWVNGKKIVRANARSSQHGRLFKYLEGKKGSYVTKSEMKQAMNQASSADQAIKDIQKVLRSYGFELDFERVRGDGLMYHGVIRQQ
jgi:hypothetical protein